MTMQTVTIEGLKLQCLVQGQGDPVVLVHGFPLDHRMWSPQIEALSRQFRVIAPNLRGFGGSEIHDEDVDDGVTMERYADDLSLLIDKLGVPEPVVLAGFSMGGYVALQFALRHANRLRGLALCDTRAVDDSDEAIAGRVHMAEAVLAAGNAEPALGMIEKLLSSETIASRPDVVARIRAMILAAPAGAIAAAQRGMAQRDDVSDLLDKIGCPALVLAGAHDRISPPAEMQQIAGALPNAEYVEIEGAAHMTTLENSSAVSNVLSDFARRVHP